MTTIKWYGHACFEIVSDKGVIIGIDPHDGVSLGIKPPMFKADIILVTHNHFDHNAIQVISKPNSRVLDMFEGETIIDDIEIKGVKSFHDPYRGSLRGEVVLYKVKVDDLNIVHLGDLGTLPEDELLREITPADILMVPVGGVYTISPSEAAEVVKKIKPKIAIPMHYKIPGLRLGLRKVDEFLRKIKYDVKRISREFTISKPSLPSATEVWVLTYQ
ncbi:MAG: Zn-dependent hydrolase [Thermoprotei archaeon]|nr:MAG: Zn-dependent hydrolase [Thermoprotei archaeon]